MKGDRYRLLCINPGSTSTKVSLFENETSVFERSLFHDSSVLLKFPHVNDQMPFRRGIILDMLKSEGVDPASMDAFVGRGGGACSQPGGMRTGNLLHKMQQYRGFQPAKPVQMQVRQGEFLGVNRFHSKPHSCKHTLSVSHSASR